MVVYNGMRWIKKCLECLAESEFPVRTLVIDNGSTDGSARFVEKTFPGIHVTITQQNLGYGKATNMGIVSALKQGATHILLLNQDAYVERTSIGKLVAAQVSQPEYGIVSPVQLNGNGDDFDSNFYRYLLQSDLHSLLLSALLNQQMDSKIIRTNFVCGAAWMITKECIEKVGGFDPAFFHYGEDDNYTSRALYQGFKIGILPAAFISHDRDLSSSHFHSKNILHFRRDSTILLNRACDPNQTSYKPFLAKRFLRYGVLGIANGFMFKKEKRNYHFSMAKFIFRNYKNIQKSRQASLYQTMPHLPAGLS